MAGKWSTAHAQVAVTEVQARSDAHRKDALASGAEDLSRFELRDEELASLREMLAS